MSGLKTGRSKRAKKVIFWTSEYYSLDRYSSVILFEIIALILYAQNDRLNNRFFQVYYCPSRSNSMEPTTLHRF
jgi:hypothetical protein